MQHQQQSFGNTSTSSFRGCTYTFIPALDSYYMFFELLMDIELGQLNISVLLHVAFM